MVTVSWRVAGVLEGSYNKMATGQLTIYRILMAYCPSSHVESLGMGFLLLSVQLCVTCDGHEWLNDKGTYYSHSVLLIRHGLEIETTRGQLNISHQ